MWARVVEFMLGCWLAVSPFIFGHGSRAELWIIDWTAASVVIGLALVSYWRPLRHAHLITAAVACAMIVAGRFLSPAPLPPALQNDIVVGLLLLMFALVPNQAGEPPLSWHKSLPR